MTAALAIATSAGGASSACKPGVTTINGTSVRVFCGPATATVHVQVGTKTTKTYVFRNGQCDRFQKYFNVNIGKVVLGLSTKTKPAYFALLMSKAPAATALDPVVSKDGTYNGGLLAIETGQGPSYFLRGSDQLTVTLTKRRHAGSLVGGRPGSTLFNQPAIKITGSFTC